MAASIYKGGLQIKSLDEFLNFALQVEDDAAVHYARLAAAMKAQGNDEVGELFTRLEGYSRMHYQEAKRRMVSRVVPLNVPARTLWPDNVTPERTAIWAGDARLSRLDALKVALQGERRGYEFYYAVANTHPDPAVCAVAKEFVKEESEHVEALKQWIAREEPQSHMETVEEFLAYAIRLEQEAALRFGQLADAMATAGNREVMELFRRLSEYSRLHLADARARAGFRELPQLKSAEFDWPDIESPEAAAIWAADPLIGREQALHVALQAESAGLAYYQGVLDSTKDPEIRALAREFVAEETMHVAELQRWIALSTGALNKAPG